MVYNVYGPQQVDDAVRRYNSVANSAPTYRDSAATQNARLATDYFAKRYTDTVNKGYKSAYGDQISTLADRYRDNKFEWSADNSADYQTQKDYYRREGEKAQENVQGAYSANTGGYSNSYARLRAADGGAGEQDPVPAQLGARQLAAGAGADHDADRAAERL